MCDRVTPPSHVFRDKRGTKENAIPVFIVEEHREAYFVISYAIKTGLLPPHGNALVHIDEHHDLACPVLLGPADVRSQPLSDIFVCTFDYLRICDFLIPLVHQRVFEELYWVRRDGLCRRSIPLDIRVEQVGNAYFFRVHTLKSRAEAGARRLPMLHTLTPSHPFATTRPVVLDIDFDYFSCSDSNGETVRIEITKDAYAAFIRDKRHPWKLAFGSRVTCMEEGGKYYLLHRDYDGPPCQRTQNKEQIYNTVLQLMEFLRINKIFPIMVLLSRSQHSGFVPPEHGELIESVLLSSLADEMTINVIELDELLTTLGLVRPVSDYC